MGLLENLKAIILKSIITWSAMGQQTSQVKEAYYRVPRRRGKRLLELATFLRNKLGICAQNHESVISETLNCTRPPWGGGGGSVGLSSVHTGFLGQHHMVATLIQRGVHW